MACSVATCKNKCGIGGLQGFKFPLNETLCKKWVASCQRENWAPTKYSVLCEVHFEESQFIWNPDGSRNLKHNAVPVIFESTRLKIVQKFKKTTSTVTSVLLPTAKARIQSSVISKVDSIEDISVIPANPPIPEPMSSQSQSIYEPNSKYTRRKRGFCYLCKDIYEEDSRLFSFPSNQKRLSLWASACNIDPDRVFPGDLLCSRHFRPEDIIDRSSERKRCSVKRDAVPLPVNQIIVYDHMDQTEDPLSDINLEENVLQSSSPTQQFDTATDSLQCKRNHPVDNNFILDHKRLDSIENVPCDVEDYQPEVIPVQPTSTRWTKRPYIGDFKESDMDNAVTARQFYDVATREIMKKRRTIRTLQAKLNRFQTVRSELKILKQKLRREKKLTEDSDSNCQIITVTAPFD